MLRGFRRAIHGGESRRIWRQALFATPNQAGGATAQYGLQEAPLSHKGEAIGSADMVFIISPSPQNLYY